MARSQADRVFHGLCRPGTQSGPVVFFTARSRRVRRGTRVPRQLQKSISVQKSGRNLHRFRSGVFLQNSALAIRQLIPFPCTVTTSPRLWAGNQPCALPRYLSCPPRITPCPTSGCRRCNYGKAKAEYGRIVARHETADRVRLSPEWNKSVRSVAGKDTKNTGQPGATLQRFRKNVISF